MSYILKNNILENNVSKSPSPCPYTGIIDNNRTMPTVDTAVEGSQPDDAFNCPFWHLETFYEKERIVILSLNVNKIYWDMAWQL